MFLYFKKAFWLSSKNKNGSGADGKTNLQFSNALKFIQFEKKENI